MIIAFSDNVFTVRAVFCAEFLFLLYIYTKTEKTINILMEKITPALEKIVIIEDDIAIKMLLSTVLEYNFEVHSFENGLEALAYLQAGNMPVIIISDLNTPELNGYDLLVQLKDSSFFSAIPVLILSGEESSETRIKCLEAGADDYLLKPFNPRELEARISVILKRYGKSPITKQY